MAEIFPSAPARQIAQLPTNELRAKVFVAGQSQRQPSLAPNP
jgi:hypothetical protein